MSRHRRSLQSPLPPAYAALLGLGALCAAPAGAQTLVQACDDSIAAAGVPITGTVTFRVWLDRDPATATEATLRFTAYDPDRTGEVAIQVRAPGAAAPVSVGTLNNLSWGGRLNGNERKATYVTTVPRTALAPGENLIEVTDVDTGSPFSVHRLCVGLEGAAAPPSPPPLERFCARLRAPSATVNDGAGTHLPFAANQTVSATITADRELVDARMGFDVVAFTAESGLRFLTLRAQGNSQSQQFQARGSSEHYLLTTATTGPSLLLGTAGGGGVSTLEVRATFADKLWELCMVVAAPETAEDAGPGVVDAGGAPVDAGIGDPVDGGPELDDGGAPDPVDAGAPVPAPPDAGGVDAGRVDAGRVDAGRVDAGPIDADTPGGGNADAPPDGDGSGDVPPRLEDTALGVQGGCSAAHAGGDAAGAPGAPALALLAILRLRPVSLRRPRRGSRP